jgi:hypothetical protein
VKVEFLLGRTNSRVWVMVFSTTFNNISVVVNFIDRGNLNTQGKPLTCRQLLGDLFFGRGGGVINV